MSNILLAPVYPPILLAKSAASIDQLSGGRFTLGMAAGGRADDYAAAGRDFRTRGRDFDAGLELMHRAWRGEPVAGGEPAVCPTPVHDARVPVLIGGGGEHALRRVTAWGDGWTAGGSGPDQAGPMFERVRAAWAQAGRPGRLRLAALVYFSLGDEVEPESRGYLRDYYGFTGEYAEMIAGSALRTPAAIKDTAAAFADLGCSELYFDPTSLRLDQVDRLADAVL